MYLTYNIVKGNKYYHWEEKQREGNKLKRTYFHYVGRLSDSEIAEKLKEGIEPNIADFNNI